MRNMLRMWGLFSGGVMLAIAASLVALAGCASRGLLESAGPSDSFSVATDPDSAYRRAAEYVRVCHKSRRHPYGAVYNSTRDADDLPDDSSAFGLFSSGRANDAPKKRDLGRIRIYKVGEEAKIIELFEAKLESTAPVSTRMTVSVIGSGIWDKAELAAARQSIVSATPVCRPLE